MFKRSKKDLTERQVANRLVNKILTYALLGFLAYTFFFQTHQPALKHFNFTKQTSTPVKLPPLAQVKNLDNGETNAYVIDKNGLTLSGNNVVNIIP